MCKIFTSQESYNQVNRKREGWTFHLCFCNLLVFPCRHLSEFLLWAIKFIPCKRSLSACICQVCKMEFILVCLVGWMCYYTWILLHFHFYFMSLSINSVKHNKMFAAFSLKVQQDEIFIKINNLYVTFRMKKEM